MDMIHRWRWGAALQTYLDGESTPRRLAMVIRHVAECPDCASEIELFGRMQMVLARLGGRDGPDRAVPRLRSQAAHLSA